MPEASDNRTVRYAVVGLGHISQVAALPAFHNAENSELVALVSGHDHKLAELGDTYGIADDMRVHYDDFDQLMASGEVDAIYIGLPNHLHCDYTVRALERGVDVLVEKPMAVTTEECQAMIRAADDYGQKLMVAYRLHFEAANLEVVELIRAGEIGQVRFFDSTFTQQVKEGDIRLNPIAKGGGSVYDMGIYCINAARYLLADEPTEVVAVSESADDDPRFDDCDEYTHATMRFPGHRVAAFTSSFGANKASTFRVVGTDGEIRMDPAYRYATHLRYELIKDGEVAKARTFDKRDQFGPELVYFSDCILHDEEPEPNGVEGLIDVGIIQAIYESASQGGRPVKISPTERTRRPDADQVITRPGFPKPEEVDTSGPSAGE